MIVLLLPAYLRHVRLTITHDYNTNYDYSKYFKRLLYEYTSFKSANLGSSVIQTQYI